ncbi:beta strand repeat-containing protein, partial [Dickeya lacustris]
TLEATTLTTGHDSQLLSAGTAWLRAASLTSDGVWQAGRLLIRGGEMHNAGQLESDGALDITLTAQALSFSNDGTLAAGGPLSLTGDYQGTGRLYSDAALSLTGNTQIGTGGRWQAQDVTVTGGSLTSAGQVNAAGALTLTLTDGLTNGGTLAGGITTLQAGWLDNSGLISGRNGLTVMLPSGTSLLSLLSSSPSAAAPGALRNSGRLEGQRLAVNAASLSGSGMLLGVDALTLAITGAATNGTGGQWLSGGALGVTAASLDNAGEVQGDTLTLSAVDLTSRGRLLGLNGLTLEASTLTSGHDSQLLSAGTALLRAASLTSDGVWQAGRLLIRGGEMHNAGQLESDGALDITLTGGLGNSGALRANGAAQWQAATLSNSGEVSVRGALTAQVLSFSNDGTLAAGGPLSLTGDYQGTGRLYSDGVLSLTGNTTIGAGGRWQADSLTLIGDTLINAGQVNAAGALTLTLADGLTNGGTLAGGITTLRAGMLDNSGLLSGRNGLTVTLPSGTSLLSLLSSSSSAAAPGTLRNSGRLEGQRLTVNAASLSGSGTLLGVDALTLAITGAAVNGTGGQWLSGGALGVTAASLENAGEVQGDTLTLSAVDLTNRGRLLGLNGLTLDASTLTSGRDSQLLSAGTALLRAASLTSDGVWQAGRLLIRGGEMHNAGQLESDGALDITLTGSLGNSGALRANGAAQWQAATLSNSGEVSVRGALTAQVLSFSNDGTLAAGGPLSLTGDYQGTGRLYSDGVLSLTGNTTIGAGGRWQADSLTLIGDTLINAGQVNAAGALTLTLTDGLTNSGTLAGGITALRAGWLDNSGLLSGRNGLTVTLPSADTASVNSHAALSASHTPSSMGAAGDNATGLNTATAVTLLNNNTVSPAPGTLRNSGRLEGQRLAVNAASLSSGGTLLGVDALTLAITGAANNGTGGQWLSGGALGVTAATLDNAGEVQGDTLTLSAVDLTNRGRLLGLNGLTLEATTLTSGRDSQLLSAGTALLRAASLTSDGVWQAGRLLIRGGEMHNAGQLESDGALDITLTGSLGNSGALRANGAAQWQAATLSNSGEVSVRGALTAQVLSFSNDGTLAAGGPLSLTGDYQGTGRLYSDGVLSLTGNTTIGAGGRWQADSLTLIGDTLINAGQVNAAGALTLTLTDGLTN